MQPTYYRLLQISLCLGTAVLLFSCGDRKAQTIVDYGIKAHGGPTYETVELEFDFRGRHYTVTRHDGLFTYTRTFADTTGRIKDVLNNSGLTRYRNDSLITLSDERRKAFANSVNSVIYFSLLPYGLNDKQVNKQWVNETTIGGERYDVVRVTFDKSGGVSDHEDVYLYWFNQKTNSMDFFAYSFQVDGGGLRFRKAVNPRNVGGLLLQDYINYKPKVKTVPLDSLEALFVSGGLEKLSEIRLNNLKVNGSQNSDDGR